MIYFGLARQPHDFPCPSLLVPINQLGDFAEGLLGNVWLAFGLSRQEEESLLNLEQEKRCQEPLCKSTLEKHREYDFFGTSSKSQSV
jgi:hypothetical protein